MKKGPNEHEFVVYGFEKFREAFADGSIRELALPNLQVILPRRGMQIVINGRGEKDPVGLARISGTQTFWFNKGRVSIKNNQTRKVHKCGNVEGHSKQLGFTGFDDLAKFMKSEGSRPPYRFVVVSFEDFVPAGIEEMQSEVKGDDCTA